MEVEYYVLSDKTGFPTSFCEFGPLGFFYGLQQGSTLKEYKIGYHETWSIYKSLDYFKIRIPAKFSLITHTHVCFYTVTEDGEF